MIFPTRFECDFQVRSCQFSNDGRKFFTASYDKTVKLWDTETGEITLETSGED